MAEPIRIGIVGCGQISQHHMSTYQGIAGAKMVAFCDANREAAEAASAKYGPGDVYTDFRELLKRDDIDAIDVCLHNNLHMPVTVAGLEAGKHVYCEKPMAGSYVDALKMREVAHATGKRLHIQLSTLYSNETRATRELIAAGELGDVFFARSAGFRRRGRPYVDGYGTANFVQKKHASGGALYDMGVYHISMCLFLLDNPAVERITGKTYQRVPMDANRQGISNYDVEELGVGFVRFAGDKSMDLIESWAANLDQFEGSYVLGSLGGVRLNPFGFFKNVGHIEFNSTANLNTSRYRWDNVVGDGAVYGNSQSHWVAALQGEIEPYPTADIALNTMLISEGIYLSEKLGREVTAGEVREHSVSTALVL
jgi:predicted dehydrogenase